LTDKKVTYHSQEISAYFDTAGCAGRIINAVLLRERLAVTVSTINRK
jgi:hypothetical protein